LCDFRGSSVCVFRRYRGPDAPRRYGSRGPRHCRLRRRLDCPREFRRSRGEKVVAKETVVAETPEAAPKAATKATAIARPPRNCADDIRALGSEAISYAAVVVEGATAYRAPGARTLARFGPENVNGVPTVFAVLAERLDERCRAEWYRVQLPMTTRIEVDLSQRDVMLFDGGRRVLTTRAATGSRQTPTPVGRYYVNQRLVPAERPDRSGRGSDRLDAGRPDRNPRHEPAGADRRSRLERLRPRPQRLPPPHLRARAGRHAGRRAPVMVSAPASRG
jgi:hypothetical protein